MTAVARRRQARSTAAASPISQSKARLPGASSQTMRLARIERVRGVGDRRQRLVIDRDQLGGVARGSEAFGDDHRDGVADMAHPVADHRRPRRQRRCRTVAVGQPADARDRADPVARQIRAGQHREHAGCRAAAAVSIAADDAHARAASAASRRMPGAAARCRRGNCRARSESAGPRPDGPAGRCRIASCKRDLRYSGYRPLWRFCQRLQRSIRQLRGRAAGTCCGF